MRTALLVALLHAAGPSQAFVGRQRSIGGNCFKKWSSVVVSGSTDDYFSGLTSSRNMNGASLDLQARHANERDALTSIVRDAFLGSAGATSTGGGMPASLTALLRANRDESTKSIYVLRDSQDFQTYALEFASEEDERAGEEGGRRRFSIFTNRDGAIGDESTTVVEITTIPHAEGNLGGSIWPSSIALAMASSSGGTNGLSHFPENSECLELGSGVGLGGVGVLAGSRATSVTMSDWDQAAPALVENLEGNARANPQPVEGGGGTCCCGVRLFDWQDALLPEYATAAHKYDAVFGADCVYSDEPAIVKGLAAAVQSHLSPATGPKLESTSAPRAFLWMQNRRNEKTEAGIRMCREELSQHGTVTEDAFTLMRFSTNNWSTRITPLTLVTYSPAFR